MAARGRGRNEKYSLPWLWGTTGIAYDKTKVSTPPTRWGDLWSPNYAGHVVLLDDAREMFGIAMLAAGHPKNDTDPEHIAAAKGKLTELAQGALALDANGSERYFADGSATIGALFNGNAALAMRANPDVAWALPEDGGGIWFDNLAIPARARHPDAAMALMDHLLSAESGEAVIRELPFSNPNDAAIAKLKADDPTAWAAYTGNPATSPGQDALSGLQMVKNIGPANNAAIERAWAEVAASRPPPPPPRPPEPPAPGPAAEPNPAPAGGTP